MVLGDAHYYKEAMKRLVKRILTDEPIKMIFLMYKQDSGKPTGGEKNGTVFQIRQVINSGLKQNAA